MSPKIVDKESKKLEILQSAMQVFAQNGAAKTKMIDIAKAAGIGKGTIYEYFRSKEDIFAEAFHLFISNGNALIEESLQDTDDPVEKLKILIDVSLTGFIKDGGDFAGIMMDFWAEGIRNKDDRIVKIINLNQIYSEYREVISAILNDGIKKGVFRKVDTLALSAALIAAFDGLMLQWIMDRDLFDMRQVSQSLFDAILNGIKQ